MTGEPLLVSRRPLAVNSQPTTLWVNRGPPSVGLVKNWKCGEVGPWSPPNKKGGGGWEKGLQGQKGCKPNPNLGIAFPIRMHVCVPMLYTLCFIGSMVPVVCSTSPTHGPKVSKRSCQCGYAIVSPELQNSSCQQRTGPCSTTKTLRASELATIHHVKGVCPWRPSRGGGVGKGATRAAPGPTVSIFPVPCPVNRRRWRANHRRLAAGSAFFSHSKNPDV